MNCALLRQTTVKSSKMSYETQRFAQQIFTIFPLVLGIVKIFSSRPYDITQGVHAPAANECHFAMEHKTFQVSFKS